MRRISPISFAAIGSLIAAGVASDFSFCAPASEPEKKRQDEDRHEFKPQDINPLDKPRSKRARRRAAGKARGAK